jgi:hypothetical protein
MRRVLWRANSDVTKGCRRIKKTGRVFLSGRDWKHSPQLSFTPENIVSVWESYWNRLLQRAAVQRAGSDGDCEELQTQKSYPYRSVLEIGTKKGDCCPT